MMERSIKLKRYPKMFRLLVTSFASILLIPITMTVLLSSYALQTVSNETKASYQTIAEQLSSESDLILNNAIRLNYKIATSQIIQQYSLMTERNFFQEYEIRKELVDCQVGFDNMAACYLYLPQFDAIISENNVTDTQTYFARNYTGSYPDWIEQLRNATNRSTMDSIVTQSYSQYDSFLVLRSIAPTSQDIPHAVAVTEIRPDYFANHLRFTDANSKQIGIVFYNPHGTLTNISSGEIILEAYENNQTKFQINNQTYLLLTASSSIFNSHLLYAVPMKLIQASSTNIWTCFLILLGICMVLTLLLGIYLVRKNYRPIQKICSLITANVKDALDNEYTLIEDTLQQYITQNHFLTTSCVQNTLRLQELYLEKILLAHIPDISSIPDGLKLYNISFPYPSFMLVLFQPDEESVLFQDEQLDNQERAELTQLILRNIVTELFSEICKVYIVEAGGMPVAICNLSNIQDDMQERLIHAANTAADAIRKHFQLNFTPYFSGIQNEIQGLSQAYAEVRASLEKVEDETNNRISEGVYSECIAHCISIIKEHYTDCNLSLTMIAETLSLNPSYLSRYFKQQTGIGLLDYLQHYRLNAAKELIQNDPEILLKDIAEKTGFYNVAALIRVFKKMENMTPGQYKAMISVKKENG